MTTDAAAMQAMMKSCAERLQRHTLESIANMSNRATTAAYLYKLALDRFGWEDDEKLPSYVIPSDNLYDYGRTYFSVTLAFTDEELAPLNDPDNATPETIRAAWRLRAQKIATTRMWFKIPKLTREVWPDTSVHYTGEGHLPYDYAANPSDQVYKITINVPKGGLPPTCEIIAIEEPYESKGTRTIIKTVCR